MSATSQIADELLALAKQAASLGLQESSRQITIAAGLVLAEAGDMCGNTPTKPESSGAPLAVDTGDNVVPFRRPSRPADTPRPVHTNR